MLFDFDFFFVLQINVLGRRSSADEENDIVLPTKPLISENGAQRRRSRRNPFKKIYSNIMHSADQTDSQNSRAPLRHVLQRRHSTVFPLAQVAKELVFFYA